MAQGQPDPLADAMKYGIMGAEVGSIIPGIGTAIGAGAGAILGAIKGGIQLHNANKAGNAANSLQPGLYDPMQTAMLDEIQQKKNSLQSGSAYASNMGAIDATTAGTQNAITQVTGGDVSGTIEGLLAAQTNAGRAKNQVLGQADQANQFYSTLGVDLQNKISSRSMELQLAMQAQKRAEWAQGKQNAMGNLNAAAALTDPGSIDWVDLLQRHSQGAGLSLSGNPGITDIPDSGILNTLPQAGGDLSSLTSMMG
jgi:hypothetical protein